VLQLRGPVPTALVQAMSLAVALGVALTACSGSSGGSGSGSAAASTTAATPTATATSTDGPATPTAKATEAPTRGAPATGSTGAPSVATSFAPPVKAGTAASISTGVKVTAGKIRTITVGANGPGEVAGPAVAIPLTVRNDSGSAFNLDGLAVNVVYHHGTPGDQTTAGPSKLLTGSLKPGGTAKGTYVFNVPGKYASTVQIQVASDQSPTIVQFTRS
jgi:hypothetical protein